MFTDIFQDDAFSLVALTAAINNVEHIPGRAGELCFVGAGEGVSTLTVSIESKSESLSLIQTSPRGGPAPKEGGDKPNLRSVSIPQIKLESTIGAYEVQGVRQFGSTDELLGAQDVVNTRMNKLAQRHDLTIEHHRLGALRGTIKDADSSTLVNLFSLFGITNDNTDTGGGADDASPKEFGYDLASPSSDSDDIRIKNMELIRWIKRHAKMILPAGFKIHAFCGDEFFDALISREDIKRVYENTSEQIARLGKNYEFGIFEFGGVIFENYQGTDDNSTVAVSSQEAVAFLTGVPGLYAEYFAPADFFETTNTIGLPRYAKVAVDQKFNRYVELHTQQNPLPLCLRPQTLTKLKLG